jgi:hypothetical protein
LKCGLPLRAAIRLMGAPWRDGDFNALPTRFTFGWIWKPSSSSRRKTFHSRVLPANGSSLRGELRLRPSAHDQRKQHQDQQASLSNSSHNGLSPKPEIYEFIMIRNPSRKKENGRRGLAAIPPGRRNTATLAMETAMEAALSQQSENVPFVQSRNVTPLISERSLPFPLARIVLLAAEPVKAALRRAQNRRAALTEPIASRKRTSLTRGNGMGALACRPQVTFLPCSKGDISILL